MSTARVEYTLTRGGALVLVRLRGTEGDCKVFAGAVERRALETEGVSRIVCSQRTPASDGCTLRLWCADRATATRVADTAARVLAVGSTPPRPLGVVP